MKKTVVILLLTISLFGFSCCNSEEISNKKVKDSNEVAFCALMASPEIYKSKTIKIKAVIRGYHDFVLYDENCCELEMVAKAQGIDFEGRRKLFEKIREVYPEWNKSDVKGEITVLGRLEDNDIKPIYSFEKMCRYKFTISEVVDYQPNQALTDSCFLKIADSVIIEKK
jgi:hypothetical protein